MVKRPKMLQVVKAGGCCSSRAFFSFGFCNLSNQHNQPMERLIKLGIVKLSPLLSKVKVSVNKTCLDIGLDIYLLLLICLPHNLDQGRISSTFRIGCNQVKLIRYDLDWIINGIFWGCSQLFEPQLC